MSEPPSEPRPPAGRVLLVDDEVMLTRALALLLQRHGFFVETRTSAREALAHGARDSFDVIVTDVNMPDMSGLELLKEVRGYDPDVPVILLTGAPAIETAAQAVNFGALQYLLKPVPANELLRAIRRAIQLHRLAETKRQALRELGDHTGEGPLASLRAGYQRALDTLWIAFQPIVSTSEGHLYGYEALLRSNEPTLPHPSALIRAAERLGKLPELGRQIRRRTLSALPERETWSIFLNVHPVDLAQDTLLDDLAERPALLPRMVLEVTERASLEQVPAARERIATLRAAGCRIAIDDLGAGYAGLSSFVQLEPDVVKLDMSLVRDADKSSVKRRLIRSLTDVCQDLGYSVLGEGVETVAERDVLVDLGCDLLQGYRFGHPARPFITPTW